MQNTTIFEPVIITDFYTSFIIIDKMLSFFSFVQIYSDFRHPFYQFFICANSLIFQSTCARATGLYPVSLSFQLFFFPSISITKHHSQKCCQTFHAERSNVCFLACVYPNIISLYITLILINFRFFILLSPHCFVSDSKCFSYYLQS